MKKKNQKIQLKKLSLTWILMNMVVLSYFQMMTPLSPCIHGRPKN